MRAPLAIPALALLLSGCAVGPDYERPKVDAPIDWRWKKAEPRDAIPRGAWWTIFGDAELNKLEVRAQRENQDAAAALARFDEARALSRSSAGAYFPQVDMNPQVSRQATSATESTFGIQQKFYINTFAVPFDLSYEVDVWGRVRRTVAAADARAAASQADLETVRLGIAADLASDYFLMRALDAEEDVLTRTLAVRRESAEMLGSQLKFGAIDALDAARADTDVSTTEASIADVKRRRFELSNAMALLCGAPASSFDSAANPLKTLPPEIPAAMPSTLLERRPDVAHAERILAATNEEIGVAVAAFFPKLSLTAQGGVETSDLSQLFDWKSTFWNIGANLAAPLFEGGTLVANRDAAQARYAEALAGYRGQVLIAFKDVEDALLDLHFLAEQARAQEAAIASARVVTTLSQQRYDAGLVSYLDVIDARRTQLSVEEGATQILGQRYAATVRLVKSLGGGWREKGEATP